jgi:Protein of unknown function (DUF3800)
LAVLLRKAFDLAGAMTVYCDESGGVGRGVMTLAAVQMSPETADELVAAFRVATGLIGELKGSRIEMAERALFYNLFAQTNARATIGIAISALKPALGEDKGDHDRDTYAALLVDVISSIMQSDFGCTTVIIDDGRYDALSLGNIHRDIAARVGPCGQARLELSHRSAGLQIADVIANSFFNRAFVTDRQPKFAALVQPFLDNRRMTMRVLKADVSPTIPAAAAKQ